MSRRLRASALPVALFLALFVLAGVIGYVYSHEPARDTLVVDFEGTPLPAARYVIGAVSSIEGDSVRLNVGGGGSREVAVGAAPIEDLQRLEAIPADGTRVNVGVDDTAFGQVLTGVVAFEELR